MSEAPVPGKGEWRRAHVETPPDFHLDMNKVDVVQTPIDQIGWDDALTKINDAFDKNPKKTQRPAGKQRSSLGLYDENKGLKDSYSTRVRNTPGV